MQCDCEAARKAHLSFVAVASSQMPDSHDVGRMPWLITDKVSCLVGNIQVVMFLDIYIFSE